MKTTTNTAAAAANNARIAFVRFTPASSKAVRKIQDDAAVATVNRAVTRWFYS